MKHKCTSIAMIVKTLDWDNLLKEQTHVKDGFVTMVPVLRNPLFVVCQNTILILGQIDMTC